MSKKDAQLERALTAALAAGTSEHYVDAELYDHEYKRRKDDVRWYRALAEEHGDPVLELGCGSGRLLVPLVRDDEIAVTGVDLSAQMLRRCEERLANAPAEARARATLVRADFRALSLGRRFPLVVSPFNAMMHLYDRADVERFFAVVQAHLAPDGVFAFDVINPDMKWLSRDPHKRWSRTKFRHPRTGEWMTYSVSLVYDNALQIQFIRIFYERAAHSPSEKMPRAKVVRLAHRQFFPLELEALLHYNGFEIVRRDGDFDGGELVPESEQQVVVCRLRRKKRRAPSQIC